jgi:CheY-like chemotaxis protein
LENSSETARKQFITDLEKGLRNLYDPIELRKSPLIYSLNLATQDDPAITMRRAIVNAIQSLKPDGRIPADAQARRIYEVLTYRFVEQTSQKQVANDLALSIRQLRRLEIQAILTLADQLLVRQPNNRITGISKGAGQPEEQPSSPTEINSSVQTEAHELARLRTSLEKEEIRLIEIVDHVIRTSQPLAVRWKVEIVIEADTSSAQVSVHSASMRQALLNIMTVALQCASGGQLKIRLQERDRLAVIGFLPLCPDEQVVSTSVESQEALHLAEELVALSQGKIQVSDTEQPWQVEVLFQRLERIPVFVIDDNTDALRLIERYLEGSPFRCLGASEPTRAIAAAEEHNAQIILLDVMLPGIDGWELLGRIREHPRLGHVPVIITTILPQETLALTLGAAGFLRKPFTQEALLQMLTQQMAAVGKG